MKKATNGLCGGSPEDKTMWKVGKGNLSRYSVLADYAAKLVKGRKNVRLLLTLFLHV